MMAPDEIAVPQMGIFFHQPSYPRANCCVVGPGDAAIFHFKAGRACGGARSQGMIDFQSRRFFIQDRNSLNAQFEPGEIVCMVSSSFIGVAQTIDILSGSSHQLEVKKCLK